MGPQCFHAANAEISAYFQNSVSTQGFAAQVGSASPFAGFEGYHCGWGPPATMPVPRSNDTWGMGWQNLYEVEVMEMKAAELTQGYEVVLYGDSITENWRGTSAGELWKWSNGTLDTRFIGWNMRAVFETAFRNYRAGVMAIAGDQIAHLWWRLEHGQMPQTQMPKVAVVLIGTNDLFAEADCIADNETALETSVNSIFKRFQQMLHVMQDGMPETQIIILGLYPRGADFGDNRFQWPNHFTYPIELLNALYQKLAQKSARLHYLDCGSQFVDATGDGINQELLGDGLHPTAKGLMTIAQCLMPLVNKLAGSNATASHIAAGNVTAHASFQDVQGLEAASASSAAAPTAQQASSMAGLQMAGRKL
ncbi:g273 [Coccomyxa viridis]|uniref:G273 protein n=1 Tax=Coccomyxa viridis TaxID=1274662 RepID=A0ABP1FHB0_9CHLO